MSNLRCHNNYEPRKSDITDAELREAEAATPGHTATRGRYGEIVLTPTPDFQHAANERWRQKQRALLAGRAEALGLLEEDVA